MARMDDSKEIACATGPVTGSIRPPGSKSITNRALVCAALASGRSRLSGVLDSQDTRVMADGLARLGCRLVADWAAGTIDVEGLDGRIPAAEATLDCAASGTTIRFLSAVCGLGTGVYRLDGTPRMRKRPIGDLLDALNRLGPRARAESEGGCPPVVIESGGIRGGTVAVRGATSSQFASGLAMIGPCTRDGLELVLDGPLVSLPYLEMTRRVMESFDAKVSVDPDGRRWRIAPGGYAGRDYPVEPDASAASYFLAAAAITGGTVRVEGLGRDSLQGDVAFADALGEMGCAVAWSRDSVEVSGRAIRGIDIDMNAISDTVPTLAVVALFAEGPTTIRNVTHIRDKETDRIGDLARELRRLGGRVEETADGLVIHASGGARPGTALSAATVSTYDDHRMAMSLALVGLRVPGVRIADPSCVGKTFPGYWKELSRITGTSSR